jgi:hypothetical protein
MKLQTILSENMDFFSEVDTIRLDPDRTDTYDVAQALMPVIVKLAYVKAMQDKAKHEKANWDPDDEDYTEFQLTTDVMVEKVEEVLESLRDNLSEFRSNEIVSAIKAEKKHFKIPVVD